MVTGRYPETLATSNYELANSLGELFVELTKPWRYVASVTVQISFLSLTNILDPFNLREIYHREFEEADPKFLKRSEEILSARSVIDALNFPMDIQRRARLAAVRDVIEENYI